MSTALFISEVKFKERTGVSTAIDATQLRPYIKTAQDVFIQPALGSTLYNRLQTGVANNNLNSNEVNLLDNYVTDCLVWATMSELIIPMAYQLFSKGPLQKFGEESNTPGRNDLNYLQNFYSERAEFYKQRLINYLRANYTLFGEYSSPGCGWDVMKPVKMGYECPIYVGDVYEPCCNQTSAEGAYYTPPNEALYISAGGESTFDVAAIEGKTVTQVVRSGVVKIKTTSAPTDTNYVQVVGNTITISDTTYPGEFFIISYL